MNVDSGAADGRPVGACGSAWSDAALALLASVANGASTSTPRVEQIPGLDLLRLQTLKIDGLAQASDGAATPLQRAYNAVLEAQLRSTAEAVDALLAHGASPVLFKGIDIMPRHFPQQAPSIMGDVDLLVDRGSLGSARAALLGIGLRQAFFDIEADQLVDADIADIADVERVHYELYPFRRLLEIGLDAESVAALRVFPGRIPVRIDRDGRAWLIDEIDLHHSVALDIDPAPLFERARAGSLRGALGLSAADQLWLVCSRFYSEVAMHGKRSLRDFAYLAAIVRDGGIDWECVLRVAMEYEMRPALFYYLRFVDTLFARSMVDPGLWAELDPRTGSRQRDWGWMLAPLFDAMDPLPEWARWP